MPKYKATAYIRLSYTDDHSSESDSVSNQRKLIENFVERNPDIEVVSEKIDDFLDRDRRCIVPPSGRPYAFGCSPRRLLVVLA